MSNNELPSPWSRFRMTLWAMRVAVLGTGAWRCIATEANLRRLANTVRNRTMQRIPEWVCTPHSALF